MGPMQVGPVADGMVDRGVPLTRVRKICQGVAFLGPAACMVACALLTPHTALLPAVRVGSSMGSSSARSGTLSSKARASHAVLSRSS